MIAGVVGNSNFSNWIGFVETSCGISANEGRQIEWQCHCETWCGLPSPKSSLTLLFDPPTFCGRVKEFCLRGDERRSLGRRGILESTSRLPSGTFCRRIFARTMRGRCSFRRSNLLAGTVDRNDGFIGLLSKQKPSGRLVHHSNRYNTGFRLDPVECEQQFELLLKKSLRWKRFRLRQN